MPQQLEMLANVWETYNINANPPHPQHNKTSSLTLTFDHVTWKLIWNILTLRATTVPSLTTSKQISQKIVWTTFVQDQHFDLDLWPSDLKINRERLFLYQIWQLSNKWSKDIFGENHLVKRLTKWCKTICPFFQMEVYKYIYFINYLLVYFDFFAIFHLKK